MASGDDLSPDLRIGMVGYAFMGRVHAQAWRTVAHAFDTPFTPQLTAIAGRDPAATEVAATTLGFETYETDWRRLVERDDIDVVDICTPGDTHAEIACAALAAGKHVLCEKPLANTVEEADRMAAAAAAAGTHGIRSMVGFNYRRTPALALARQLIAAGRLGELRHVRATYLQDWLTDPSFPLAWRLRREVAGSGALGDLGAHIVDLAQFLTGANVDEVTALEHTFVKQRPLPGGGAATGGGLAHAAGDAGQVGEVTVDDAVLFLARLGDGLVGSFEATRFATGRRNAMRIEVNGSDGSIAFDFESMNELLVYDGTVPDADAGFRRILATEADHPYLSGWWPPGHGLGYEHTFTHEMLDLMTAIAEGRDPEPSFADGARVQRVLDAVQRSARDRTWAAVGSDDSTEKRS